MHDRVSLAVEAGIAEVKLNRPDKMNALDDAMFAALIETGERLKRQSGLRAVVLAGEGRAFCAGLDSASFKRMAGGPESGVGGVARLAERTHGLANGFQQAVWVWREIAVPVIAAVHGAAVGGGFQLALGADLRYVAPGTRFSVMEIKWGLIPDMAGTQLMRRLARDDVIRELTYTGRVFSAQEALAFGFASAIHDDPRAAALTTARAIARQSPEAVRAAKRLLNAAPVPDLGAGLLAESIEQDALLGGANQREAVAANLANREPRFSDDGT